MTDLSIKSFCTLNILGALITGYRAHQTSHLQLSTPLTQYSTRQHPLTPELRIFLRSQGTREDLLILDAPVLGLALGGNDYRSGDAAIVLDRKFYQKDREAACFITKHELSHIKHNDVIILNRILAASLFAFAIADAIYAARNPTDKSPKTSLLAKIGNVTKRVFCRFAGNLIKGSLIKVPQIFYSLYVEGRADNFAIQHSSIEEIKGGRRFFKALQNALMKRHNTPSTHFSYQGFNPLEKIIQENFGQIIYSASGENRMDFLHPSLQSRIQKAERALIAQSADDFDTPEEQAKIIALQAYIQNNLHWRFSPTQA